MEKNLRLVRGQIDVDGGRQHRHFEHDGRVAVPRRVVRVLSRVVLPQQLTCGFKIIIKTKHISKILEAQRLFLQASNKQTRCFQLTSSTIL